MKKVIKWLQNYWYHYKFRTIFFLFLGIVAVVTICEFATKEQYDMNVYLYTSQFISDDVEDALEETIEEYYSELGEENNVQVVDLSYDPLTVDGEMRMSYAAALTGELRMKNDFLYITDAYRFEELDKNETFDNVFGQNEFFDKYDKKAYSISGGRFEKLFVEKLAENNVKVEKMPELFLSILTEPYEDKKVENYKAARDLAQYIVETD